MYYITLNEKGDWLRRDAGQLYSNFKNGDGRNIYIYISGKKYGNSTNYSDSIWKLHELAKNIHVWCKWW